MINGKSRIYMPTFGFMISFSPDFAFKIIKIIVIAALLAKEYDGINNLPEDDRALVDMAVKAASESSYAPYSGFHVGAAVLMENGEVVCGSNQENASYPCGLCAERTALFYAHSKYPKSSVSAIAIAAVSDGNVVSLPVYPCGACRQALLESQHRKGSPIRIIMHGSEKTQIVNGVESLLPFSFKLGQ